MVSASLGCAVVKTAEKDPIDSGLNALRKAPRQHPPLGEAGAGRFAGESGSETVDVLEPHLVAGNTVFHLGFVVPFQDELIAGLAAVLQRRAHRQHLATVADILAI